MYFYIAVAMIFFITICALILRKKTRTTTEIYPFTLRPLLSQHEYKFYKALVPIANNYDCVIMTKVRLADLVGVIKGFSNSEYYSHFGKIKSKHVDFVLCDKVSINPVAVIEIDDKSHNRPDRIERDRFIDNVFKTVNLPIIHTNNINKLENQIKETLSPEFMIQKNTEVTTTQHENTRKTQHSQSENH